MNRIFVTITFFLLSSQSTMLSANGPVTLDMEALGLESTPVKTTTGISTDGPIGESDAPELTIPSRKIVYTGHPIPLAIPLKKWLVVKFPGPVKVGTLGLLNGKLQTQSIDTTIHLLAQQPFSSSPVIVTELVEPGRTYVMYLKSKAGASGATVEVIAPEPSANDEIASLDKQYDKVTLTRYAIQQLYAEPRLIKQLPGLVEVPVESHEVPLIRSTVVNGTITAVPFQAWTDGWKHVTAVLLTNTTGRPLELVPLDPREAIRGDFQTATFWNTTLGPRGSGKEVTALVLISTGPFHEALYAYTGAVK